MPLDADLSLNKHLHQVGTGESGDSVVAGPDDGEGAVGLAIDQPGSIAQLAFAVTRGREVPVAYVPDW